MKRTIREKVQHYMRYQVGMSEGTAIQHADAVLAVVMRGLPNIYPLSAMCRNDYKLGYNQALRDVRAKLREGK